MADVVRFARVETDFGELVCAATAVGLCAVVLDAGRSARVLEAWTARHAPAARLVEDAVALASIAEQLRAFGAGQRRTFDLPLDVRGSEFERAVWAALAEIPFGATQTYGALAARIGRPGAARAVGRAAGANPIPVVIPCHRLLARGGLGGFSGGLDLKRRLLGLEGHAAQAEFL